MQSHSEENYLKAIFELSGLGKNPVSTNALAKTLEAKAPSVTEMVKKLSEKGLVTYEKYQGCILTDKGSAMALQVIRKHRLWEVFLVKKLGMGWEEVHEIAEQLEHIRSEALINKLEVYLGFPKYDPHGEPIPDKHGHIEQIDLLRLCDVEVNSFATIKSVADDSEDFLKFLDEEGIFLGSVVHIIRLNPHDGSLKIKVNHQKSMYISRNTAEKIYVKTDE
ncbi:metal-dependent transcriptional regulator [Schleiferia thermophila]|uniref:metal-dependent transcriptional regulator n=1 Tax=Schleiferia thermophila TaxID=884107 RepID=UPI0004E6DDAF|nr:metal-dependent transcriptional regulator [Schleiferia thermophila]KFD39718.1 iron-dependent repressor [Schleiferia thermophila str. Yellowstone]PMB38206.1 iron-dependent repressor [Fischerella thermalis CCMEE 5319]